METNFLGTLAATQVMLPLLRQSQAGPIVNLSTTLGSLAVNGDPTSRYYEARLIGYNASKAALNMLTVQLAAELKNTSIVVNSVAPGYVNTDLPGHNGFMTPEEGARLPVEYALLGSDAVSGRFVEPQCGTRAHGVHAACRIKPDQSAVLREQPSQKMMEQERNPARVYSLRAEIFLALELVDLSQRQSPLRR